MVNRNFGKTYKCVPHISSVAGQRERKVHIFFTALLDQEGVSSFTDTMESNLKDVVNFWSRNNLALGEISQIVTSSGSWRRNVVKRTHKCVRTVALMRTEPNDESEEDETNML